MKKLISVVSIVSLLAFGAMPFSAYATTCGFGSDIGGGQCRGFIIANPGKGNQTFDVPTDWTTTNTIECIGSGGTGAKGNTSSDTAAGGGGGGAYALISNLSLTPGGTATYAVGATATTTGVTVSVGMARETYFNGTASSTASVSCAWGRLGTVRPGGIGGPAALSTGDTKYSGGTGGTPVNSVDAGGGGGGGSAGPTGAGQVGANGSSGAGGGGTGGGGSNGGSSSAGTTNSSQTGGGGGNGTGGTGGGTGQSSPTAGTVGGGGGGSNGVSTNGSNPGASGGCDTAWDATHGACGGGGGSGGAEDGSGSNSSGVGGPGGTYGGGGGGSGAGFDSSGNGGAGGQGIIVVTYTPAVAAGQTGSVTRGIWNVGKVLRIFGGGLRIF